MRWVRHPGGGMVAESDPGRLPDLPERVPVPVPVLVSEGRDFYMYDGDEFAFSEDWPEPEPLVPGWVWWVGIVVGLAFWLWLASEMGVGLVGALVGALLLIALRWRDSVLLR
jgi:hypothetical protein